MSTSTNSEPDESIVLDWQGDFRFEATAPSGSVAFDSSVAHGGQGQAISPLEAFLASAAACSAIDVVSILMKQRQKLNSYRVEIEYIRRGEGDYPHPIISLTLHHILSGDALDEAAVRRAVELSDTKYCTVIATLRSRPEVQSVFRIE